jgi:hypothetical protein
MKWHKSAVLEFLPTLEHLIHEVKLGSAGCHKLEFLWRDTVFHLSLGMGKRLSPNWLTRQSPRFKRFLGCPNPKRIGELCTRIAQSHAAVSTWHQYEQTRRNAPVNASPHEFFKNCFIVEFRHCLKIVST